MTLLVGTLASISLSFFFLECLFSLIYLFIILTAVLCCSYFFLFIFNPLRSPEFLISKLLSENQDLFHIKHSFLSALFLFLPSLSPIFFFFISDIWFSFFKIYHLFFLFLFRLFFFFLYTLFFSFLRFPFLLDYSFSLFFSLSYIFMISFLSLSFLFRKFFFCLSFILSINSFPFSPISSFFCFRF